MNVAQDQSRPTHDCLELERKYEELDAYKRRLEEGMLELFTLYEINKALSISMSLDELFGVLMDRMVTSLHISEFCLFLLDEESHELVIRASRGLSEEAVKKVRFAVGEGISGQAFSIGESIIVPDVSKEPGFLYYKGYKRDVGSFISVPLKLTDGRVVGVLNVHRAEKDSFTPDDENLFSAVAEQVAVAVERANTYEKTRELSIKDSLTGLYNRRYFFDYMEKEIERAKRSDRPLSLIMIDIDDFKKYNDTNGHLAGDAVLEKTAAVLGQHLRKGDVLARFGGEEFIALLPETGKDAAMSVAEKLRTSIDAMRFWGGELQPRGRVTITLGVATYPEDGNIANSLVSEADRRLYVGKARGKNQVAIEDSVTLLAA